MQMKRAEEESPEKVKELRRFWCLGSPESRARMLKRMEGKLGITIPESRVWGIGGRRGRADHHPLPLYSKSPSWQIAIMIKTQVQIPDDLFREAKRWRRSMR